MRTLLFLSVALAVSACSNTNEEKPPGTSSAAPAVVLPQPPPPAAKPDAMPIGSARVNLDPTQGHTGIGELALTVVGADVHVTGTITGLPPNSAHGFHIHEKGDCSAPDASSAGGHFNPTGQPHGDVNSSEHHAGDMMNIKADAEGMAKVDDTAKGVTIGGGGANDIVGKAIVLHEKPDDYKTQPSGDSGTRVACGVIETVR
ncbi:MAG: superoxide dismutase family protein [Dokdonella sp.]